MTEYYETEATADRAADEINEDNRNRVYLNEPFCPLLRENCKPNCVCFEKAYAKEVHDRGTNTSYYEIRGNCCTNNMFFGGQS